MNLDQLATTIGASTEVAESLLETYSIDLANITTREVESLKTVANPGSLATKPQKKAPAKQLEGGNTSVLTQGATATLTDPEAPTTVTPQTVAMPVFDTLGQQLDAQDAALNAKAADLIRTKMQQMKNNLHQTVIGTMTEYAEMPDFFDLGALFNQAPLLEGSTNPPTIDQSQETIYVQAEVS